MLEYNTLRVLVSNTFSSRRFHNFFMKSPFLFFKPRLPIGLWPVFQRLARRGDGV